MRSQCSLEGLLLERCKEICKLRLLTSKLPREVTYGAHQVTEPHLEFHWRDKNCQSLEVFEVPIVSN